MENQRSNRTKLLRELHAYASSAWQIEDPHPLLHQLAVSEFDVKSMAHLSDNELRMLHATIKKSSEIDWKKVEDMGITKVPGMSDAQLNLVKKLRKELGWSEEYLIELVVKRYGYLHWEYLTGRTAISFIGYLIKRRKEKLAHQKEEKVK